VRTALNGEVSTSSLTKRVVIVYIKTHSPAEWQEKHRLQRATNSLILKLNSAEVIAIYTDFYNTFSNHAATSKQSGAVDLEGDKKVAVKYTTIDVHNKQNAKVNFDAIFEERLLRVVNCLLNELQSQTVVESTPKEGQDDSIFRFLCAVQGVISGAYGAAHDVSNLPKTTRYVFYLSPYVVIHTD
jgi:hypothetical protein